MTDTPSAVNDLAHRFWEGVLELNPTTATFYGDARYADRLEDPSPQGRARTRALMERTAAEAAAIPIDGLSTEERITRDMLQVIGELGVEEDDQGLHQLRVVDQMGGPQQLLPQLTAFQPVDTPERLEAFIGRLHAYPAFMAANADILREALASGLTAPSIVTERVIAQLERMLAIPIESAIVPGSVQGACDADRERIREIVRDEIYPADAAFLEALRGEYRHASREEPGIWSAPNGDAIYRTAIRGWTTLEMDPQEIHRSGSTSSRRSMTSGARSPGPRASATTSTPIARRSTRRPATPRDRRTSWSSALARTSSGRWRRRRATSACCRRPAARSARSRNTRRRTRRSPTTTRRQRRVDRDGIYYANGYDLPSRKYTKLASTTYHEAAPGHHFQIALEMENPHLITFRRLGSRMVGGAYVEGWGLYSERLADEMGLYRSEGERFGMLDAQAWRAARLVVDTGLHALRWERQRSIDFLRKTPACPRPTR